MIQFLVTFFVVVLNLQASFADIYFHNPRGSNDRNCERNVNRDNANRLFNSQNNNNGGYACPRGVGNAVFQAENGTATFTAVDVTTGTTSTFTQNKRIYYYSGSVLPLEWTNQHGCGGNSKISCELVIQYACEDTLDPRVDDFWPWVTNKAGNDSKYFGTQHFRSGTNIAAPRDGVPLDAEDAATDTINDDESDAIPSTLETQRYGMHESYDHYQRCQYTERNKGLYTADQQVNRDDQRGTRQNPNGNRHGFECPEERDYYPWWAPSPWIDIAVLSDSANDTVCYKYSKSCTKRCEYYMNNTMNWNKKGYCDVSHNGSQPLSLKLNSQMWQQRKWYNNKEACVKAGFHWFEISHADNLNLANNSFVCAKTQFTRVNQLGNADSGSVVSQNAQSGVAASHVTEGVNANRFLWTVPQIPTSPKGSKYFSNMTNAYKSCVLRIRYNISSADYQQWPSDAVDAGAARMVDYKNNSRTSSDLRSPLHQDPYVTIGPGDDATKAEQFVKLKLNTNQYGRTFQDRSYVFSIKPLPTTSSASSDAADTPAFDATAVKAALAAGGKIYNVNVRGKRGNIVQVYPSVEYDFVPNALSLGVNDMVHFQWTGSDYNPQRGCNDATGGPPDLNAYSTDANADQNSRADRSNIVFTNHMGNNVPKDYLGYTDAMNLTWTEKLSFANATVLENAPCYNNKTDSLATGQACYKQMMRLAFLNQQSDSGSLVLRAGQACLTQTQLDAISNEDVADNHPLNCAKLNAKPYPYFDGGVMVMKKNGWFSYYSSRNNNFSNRQNVGVLCVGSTCKVDPSTGVLQDTNPETSGTSTVTTTTASAALTPSKCFDTANGSDGANANGAHSCLPTADAISQNISYILTDETFATQEQDNDALGDGNAQGCAVLMYSSSSSSTTVEDDLALAFILLAVGLFTSWLAYYLYNRYQARRAEEGKFRYDTAWKKAEPVEKSIPSAPRPTSLQLTEINPGVKIARPKAASTSAPAKNYQKFQRTEMI